MSNQQEQEPVYLTSTNDDNLVFVKKKKKSFRSQAFSRALMQSTTGVSMCVYSTTLQRVQ